MDVARRERGVWVAVAAGFAALLIAPEQPFERVGLGRAFEATFVASAYVFLIMGLVLAARSGGKSPGGSDG